MGRLGCGAWRAYLQCRGGGVLTELPVAALSMGRALDEVSAASVTVTGNSLSRWSRTRRSDCCGYIAELNPWEHELALFRGEGDDPAWVGPILTPTWGRESVTIAARDLAQWFERRLLEHDRTLAGMDLADIFRRYAVDALHRDPTPNMTITVSPTGIIGDRSVLAGARRRAMDEMRELARSGVDFTAKGREILVGGTEVPTPAIGPFIAEHFAEPGPTSSLDGLAAATEATVVGARGDTTGNPVMGVAGGIDPAMGLVQDAMSESSIEDEASAQAAAQSRYDMLATAPEFVSGQLAAEAPVGFDDLVPGARADLRLALFCRDVVGVYRLAQVSASVSVSGDTVDEKIGVQFVTLGTIEEAA